MPIALRLRSVVAAVATVALAGCASEGAVLADKVDQSALGPTRRVEVDGIAFEVPRGWEELSASDVLARAEHNDGLDDLAEHLGLSPDRLVTVMKSIDLYLFSDEGAAQGLVATINVLDMPGPVPTDSELKLQLFSHGAKNVEIAHASTDAGEATKASYQLKMADGLTPTAVGVVIGGGAGTVFISISAEDEGTLKRIEDLVVYTLESADASMS